MSIFKFSVCIFLMHNVGLKKKKGLFFYLVLVFIWIIELFFLYIIFYIFRVESIKNKINFVLQKIIL